ncbi:glycosyltransferase [Segatella buccae]|uniref:glycosyltransferase family 2 protein n=2 Tax=Segatella buccae TaxID=28126 RepID=UPI0028E343EF|nr:glycosyltransferase [Segatella buccae]
MLKLSIIIPAYNVEGYIGRCLDSIYFQNSDEEVWEVIVINDGSTDTTAKVVEGYKQKHNNLNLINRPNGGASAARNVGIREAKGAYIWFVDSDDKVADNSINRILEYCKDFPNADMLFFDCKQFDMEDRIAHYWKTLNDRYLFFLRNSLYLKKLTREDISARIRSAVIWLFVCKREYILCHDLFFVEGIINEDNEYYLRLLFFAKEIRYIPAAPYIYTLMRPGSVTTLNFTGTMKIVEAAISTIHSWDKFCKKFEDNRDVRFVSRYYKAIYTKLLLLKNEPRETEIYKCYLENHREWLRRYNKYFWKSNISIQELLRYASLLWFPKYYDYISLIGIRKLLYGNK